MAHKKTARKKLGTLPIEIDAESVLNTTLARFRERMTFGTPVTADDMDFLEKAMKAYAALKYDAKGKEAPMSELVAALIRPDAKLQKTKT